MLNKLHRILRLFKSIKMASFTSLKITCMVEYNWVFLKHVYTTVKRYKIQRNHKCHNVNIKHIMDLTWAFQIVMCTLWDSQICEICNLLCDFTECIFQSAESESTKVSNSHCVTFGGTSSTLQRHRADDISLYRCVCGGNLLDSTKRFCELHIWECPVWMWTLWLYVWKNIGHSQKE